MRVLRKAFKGRCVRASRRQAGQALLIVVTAMSLAFLIVASGITVARLSSRLLARQLTHQGQAANVAAAGLVEGLSWFRRQQRQPVAQFLPRRDDRAEPPVNDTEDPEFGLVREYEISSLGRVWGRYALRRSTATGSRTIDITVPRGKRGEGTVWQLESEGIVYVRNDEDRPFDERPNFVLARRTLRTDIQRLSITLPSGSALNVSRSNCVTVGSDVRIKGGSEGSGLAWQNTPSGGTPTGAGYPDLVSGNPSVVSDIPLSPDRFTIQNVFGVTRQELLAMADLVVDGSGGTTAVSKLPATLPAMSLIVIDDPSSTHTFTAARPLTGSGILVVFGNLSIAANSLSSFDGLVYVQGTFSQQQPSRISGTVIVDAGRTGTSRTVTLSGSGEFAEISYDEQLIQQLALRMGSYRFSRSPYAP